MGLPRITWDGQDIDFPYDCYARYPGYAGKQLRNITPTDIGETINIGPGNVQAYLFRLFENANSTHATFRRNIEQWNEYARQGYAWTFARDSAKTGLTTLALGAAANDATKTLELTSATGFAANDICIMRSATQQTIVKIASVSAPNVTLTEVLKFDFASGVRFRHLEYFPARLTTKRDAVIEKPPIHFDVELYFMEDMNS